MFKDLAYINRKEKQMQNELRSRLHSFLVSEGTTQKFIARKLGINISILSLFKNGKTDLDELDFEMLDGFLKSKNY